MALKDYDLKPKGKAAEIDRLAGLDDAGLLALRHEIGVKLRLDLNKLDLAEELGAQYRGGMVLLASVQDGKDGTPANQRAQVFNSIGAMLEKIVKQRNIVYNSERLKRYEAAFLKVLKKLPPEDGRAFFDLYGEYLAADQMPQLEVPQ